MFSRELIYFIFSYSLTGLLLYIGLVRIQSKNLKNKLKYNYHNQMLTDYQDKIKRLTQEQQRLNARLRGILMLYETTRDVSKTLDEKESLTFLKIKLKQFIDFDDCFLVNEEERNRLGDDIYYYMPLVIKDKVISYLAIKNLNIKGLSMEHLVIIVNQFALVIQKIRLYRKLQELAISDDLTQTFSRRYFMERFREEYSRCRKLKHKLSFLMLDIDHFKRCNDRFGHLVGDIVLVAVASEIKNNIREVDLLGRFGGEEFAIILPETDKSGAAYTAERIRSAIKNRTIKAYDESVKVSVSLGVATFPDDADAPEKILDRSDWSLYRAKQTGRNRVCVYGVFNK